MAACVQANLPLFGVAADTWIGGERGARNDTKRIINPLSTVPRLLRVSGTWLGLDTREIIPRNDETPNNAMFFGEGEHSARFPDPFLLCHSCYRFVGRLVRGKIN